jgi:uncharacterized protein
MSEMPASPFCHIVIPAPDLERARNFYQKVFGWTVQVNVPGPGYWFFESGNVGGGFSATATPRPDSVVLVLRVQDLGATIASIRENGGTITQEPSNIGEADPGQDAYFLDPNANAMGIYVGP